MSISCNGASTHTTSVVTVTPILRNGIPSERRHMIMGSPARVLSSYAAAHDTDVIVMGRVGHRGVERLVGSTVEHLLYKLPCSVWVVSPEPS